MTTEDLSRVKCRYQDLKIVGDSIMALIINKNIKQSINQIRKERIGKPFPKINI